MEGKTDAIGQIRRYQNSSSSSRLLNTSFSEMLGIIRAGKLLKVSGIFQTSALGRETITILQDYVQYSFYKILLGRCSNGNLFLVERFKFFMIILQYNGL